MTRSEMAKHLDPANFQAFRVTTNSGHQYDVTHPENAFVMRDDSLYIFAPVPDEVRVKELVTILRIHNICAIEKPIESIGVPNGANGPAET